MLTILVTRAFLHLTGYPQVGSGGLHIAHVLWGGLGMLVAHLMSMLFIGVGVRNAAAVVAGAGFGLFIDEVGKFLTADNNYFYEPVAAVIYAVFVATYAVVRLGVNRRPLSERERLVNAAHRTADGHAGSPAGGEWPTRIRERWRSALADFCRRPPLRRWTAPAIGLFTLFSLGRPLVLLSRDANLPNLVHATFACTAFVLAVLGLWRSTRGRSATDLFEVALMMELLVVQVFWLLDSEFAGILPVAWTVALLTLNRRHAAPAPPDRATCGPVAR
ncbi:hypothetical protein [Micromonospora robiginosa]|uniref:Uncharacterized protein n=1 Tax=Micromonospora robiginosa TaxID=2749844 RepID=A0A7L6B0E2_9ACTN|nr:hypothetical protein [Micromonospora ferruginea]QLQ35432.1 hypothetical protein H1D33_18785 [Micromonospora ferruginea]